MCLQIIIKKKEVIIRAAKLTNNDGTHVYYTCSPEENKEHMYVGFLSKSVNPNGLPMPCCFKKDHYTSKNKEKRDSADDIEDILEMEEKRTRRPASGTIKGTQQNYQNSGTGGGGKNNK